MDLMSNITTSAQNTTTYSSTTTTGGVELELPLSTGFICCAIAAILFGSNYIPVKKFETGDGIFFQWIFCIAVWISGLILHAIRGFPRFWPGAMLGGFFWATANLTVVPIIHTIGMAMGLLIWGMTNLLVGWASGRFGWFGIEAEVPPNVAYNYVGVALCCCSAIVTAFIRPHIENAESQHADESSSSAGPNEEREPLLTGQVSINKPPSYESVVSRDAETEGTTSAVVTTRRQGFFNNLPPWAPKAAGIAMSIFAGCMYGVMFIPLTYIKDNFPTKYGYANCVKTPCIEDVSSQDMDYVFAQFSGILVSSTAYFMIYCILKKNKPRIYPECILPSLISGFMWSGGMISFFIANEVLSEAISFPIINAGPGLVASLWGVLWFREIRGRRNMLLLCLCFCFIAGGCSFVVLSKA